VQIGNLKFKELT